MIQRVSLSIIIPALNASATIGRALESVLRQTLSDWELLLMDGGSNDETVAIADSYKDSRIKIHVASDDGIYDAMNHGIRLSHGDWLYFLGADDYLIEPDVLEKMLDGTTDLDVVYGDVQAPQLPPEFHGEWGPEKLSYNRCHQAVIYRRTVFDSIGLYPLKYAVCADYYINLRVFLDRRIRMKYKPVVLAHYSDGGVSTIRQDVAFYNDCDRIVVRYGWRTLPKQQLAKHCKAALSHHCTYLQRAALTLLQVWLNIALK